MKAYTTIRKQTEHLRHSTKNWAFVVAILLGLNWAKQQLAVVLFD